MDIKTKFGCMPGISWHGEGHDVLGYIGQIFTVNMKDDKKM